MNQTPEVSVIVPCFNYGHLLSECLESVRHQSLVEWECIVVDDGSGDETQAIARDYCSRDARFSYVHQENRGLSAARNTGLRRAAGEFIQLLDADDLLEPEKLKEHARFLVKQKDYSLVYGPMRYFTTGEAGRTFSLGRNRGDREWMVMWPDTTDEMLAALVQDNLFPVSAAVFRKSLLREIGYFDESLPSHEDWEFWLRAAFAGKRFCGVDAPETRTLIREHSESLSRRSITMTESRVMVRKRIEELAPNDVLREKNRECLSYDECEMGAAHLAAAHWRVGLRWFRKGFAGAKRKAPPVRSLLVHLAPSWSVNSWRTWHARATKKQGHSAPPWKTL